MCAAVAAEVRLGSTVQGRADVTPLASLFTHGCSCGKSKRAFQSHRRGKEVTNTTAAAAPQGSGHQRRPRWVWGPVSSETTGSTPGEEGRGPQPSPERLHLHAHGASLTTNSQAAPVSGGTALGVPIRSMGAGWLLPPPLPPARCCLIIAAIKHTSITHEMPLWNHLCAYGGFTYPV